MKILKLLFSIIFLSFSINAISQVNIIFDTDLGGDVDDLGALAMLHHFVDKKECNLLGVMCWSTEQYAVSAIDAVNRYYKHPDIPIGVRKAGTHHESWFYKNEDELRHNARTVIEMMADMISKNGNLLLNVELLPDGTIPADHKNILDDIGAWVNLNSEAIYGSKPWKVYGDNLDSYLKQLNESALGEADIEALKKQAQSEHFNERTVDSHPYGPEEVRFTTKGNVLYVFILNPEEGAIELASLGLGSEYAPGKVSSIKMIGGLGKIKFEQNDERLVLNIPANRPNKYTTVFEVKGALKRK